jgi:hypothetical protein
MKLVAPNIDTAAKKVLAMLAPVKRGKSKPNESPMTAQKVQNRALGGR